MEIGITSFADLAVLRAIELLGTDVAPRVRAALAAREELATRGLSPQASGSEGA